MGVSTAVRHKRTRPYFHADFHDFHADPFSSFYVKLLTDKRTDRQTNKRRALHNLLGGGNNQLAKTCFITLHTAHSLRETYLVQQ